VDKESLDLDLHWDPTAPRRPPPVYDPEHPTDLMKYFDFLEWTGALKNPPTKVVIFREQFTL
jgi:hypothetical protein